MYDTTLQVQAFDPGRFSLILDPSPGLMLGSCLVLGCSISSFLYRQQVTDKYQTQIMVISISVACVVGYVAGISANLVMLGLIPWALCAAMLLSTCVHWYIGRYCHRNVHVDYEPNEKERLLRHRSGNIDR